MAEAVAAARAYRVHAADDVAVAAADLLPGTTVTIAGVGSIVASHATPRGHKLALREIRAGDAVIKYGAPIGVATADIARGEWVHEHNLTSALQGMIHGEQRRSGAQARSTTTGRTFAGYRRANALVGTRNEVWVLPTVGCVARTAERIARDADARWRGRIDGVHAFAHPLGCSQLGGDLDGTRQLLASLVQHPNAGGVLLVGLGCESNQLQKLLETLPPESRAHVRAFNAQQQDDEFEAGVAAVDELAALAAATVREPCALADLRIGMKCGGSDAFSGLTANPLVGRIADVVAADGGAVLLTEIPELFGAEPLLLERAQDAPTAAAFETLVNDFRRYFIEQGQPLDANPSPGNRAGGITTLEEKSLGAVQKGGAATLTHIVRYGERSLHRGLGVLEAPGNDAVSSTALAAAGATLVLFTTGRGTPLGCPVPTLKIASNSALARSKPRWIDFDAGRVLDDGDLQRWTEELLALVIATASGAPAWNERNDERGIAIWKRGVTL
jgi:altronate hydrolase